MDLLRIDPEQVTAAIVAAMESTVTGRMRKRGLVLGLSGGVDSSVCAALCARALGPERVLGLLMPERESSSDSLDLGRLAAESTGITAVVEDISQVLDAAGCYSRRDDAIRSIIPGVQRRWRVQAVTPERRGERPVPDLLGYRSGSGRHATEGSRHAHRRTSSSSRQRASSSARGR
jgi:NAD+ synthase